MRRKKEYRDLSIAISFQSKITSDVPAIHTLNSDAILLGSVLISMVALAVEFGILFCLMENKAHSFSNNNNNENAFFAHNQHTERLECSSEEAEKQMNQRTSDIGAVPSPK